MLKNTATKWIVYAYTVATGLPIAGDAANITAEVRIDGGATVALTDTNPAELAAGYYVFDITAAEGNGDLILIIPVSSTAGVRVAGMSESERTRTVPVVVGDIPLVVAIAGAVLDEPMAGHTVDGSLGVAMGNPEKGLVVTDAMNTTISFKTDLASTVDSYCIGCFVKFLTGNLVNQTRRIQAYGGTSKLMLVTSAFSEMPIAGDKFIIVNQ